VTSKIRTIAGASVLALLAVSLFTGCGKKADKADDVAAALLLSQDDILTMRNGALASGPSITGSIEPERRADLRAEVPAVVLTVLKENGDPVKRGDLLVRLDPTSIRDSLTAAQSSLSAASLAFDQSERQFQRMKKLRETGVVSAQQLEDVEIQRNSAQSEREAARTRVVTARQQLARTEVRAPFDGVVSDRKVSAGDTAQVGKELLKVIDPSSLRFEGFVSADAIGEVSAGQHVWFRIHGFEDRDFNGVIARVNPAVNTTTRQIEVLVNFDDRKQQPNVAGLYAEGRVETRTTASLSLPSAALVREGDKAYAWRVKEAKLQKTALTLGDRDARSGAYLVKGGLAEGDAILRFPTSSLKDGQAVKTDNGAKPAVVAEK
jgi:membrane fusion protein, multidrug efflux system